MNTHFYESLNTSDKLMATNFSSISPDIYIYIKGRIIGIVINIQ